jgi:hypothetical protein
MPLPYPLAPKSGESQFPKRADWGMTGGREKQKS